MHNSLVRGAWLQTGQHCLNRCKNSCSTYLIDLENIPKQYKASIAKDYRWQKKVKFGPTYDTYDVHTVILKNVTAFGYPISKIETSTDGHSTVNFELHFKDKNFMKLRPDFYYTTIGKTKISYPPKRQGVLEGEESQGISYQSDRFGYNIEGNASENLFFDEKNKLIPCRIS